MTQRSTPGNAVTEPPIEIVAAAQKAILAHPFFEGGAAVAFGFANAAVKAALAATPAVGGEATCYVERSMVREIVIGHNAATQAVLPQIDALPIFTAEDFRAQFASEPIAWRWRPRGSTNWIYDPTDEWRMDNQDSIEFQPLYASQPAPPLRGREAMLAKAAQDFIDKVDRGAARSEQSYAAFKAALAAAPPKQPTSPVRGRPPEYGGES
jgi:hypothetical protein